MEGTFDVDNFNDPLPRLFNPTDVAISADGSTLFVFNNFGGGVAQDVVQYNLSTPFDITSTVTLEGNFTGPNNNIGGLEFSDDGLTAFFTDRFGPGNNNIQQFSLTNPFDLVSGTITNDGNVDLVDNIPGVSGSVSYTHLTLPTTPYV